MPTYKKTDRKRPPKTPKPRARLVHVAQFVFPEGYIQRKGEIGVRTRPELKALMRSIWERSTVMYFCHWKSSEYGKISETWYAYFKRRIRADVQEGRLSKVEGAIFQEYLDITGT